VGSYRDRRKERVRELHQAKCFEEIYRKKDIAGLQIYKERMGGSGLKLGIYILGRKIISSNYENYSKEI